MADFVAVIRRAVDGLADNSQANRERVYDKARGAVRRQLENMSPRPSDDMVRRQLDKLETAIGEVELEHTEALPPLEEGEPEAAAAGLETDAAEAAGSWPEDPGAPHETADGPAGEERGVDDLVPAPEPIIRPIPRATPRPAAEAGVSAEPRSMEAAADRVDPASLRLPGPHSTSSPGEPAAPFADAPLIGEAHDEAFGLSDQPLRGRRRRGGVRSAVLGVIVLLVLAGAAYGLWSNRLSVLPMIASLTSSSGPDAPAEPKAAAEKPAEKAQAENAAAPVGEAAPPAEEKQEVAKAETAEQPPEGGKFTQRLMADGSETNPGPAPALDQPPQGEGKSVTGQLAAAEQDAATPPQNTPATAAPQATAAAENPAISQKMYLYEERFEDKAPAATTGTIVWTLAKESPGGDALPEPAIHGEISVPEKGITALVTIKRNADKSLPASHLIEIVFALPGDFPGGGIESVQRVSMKQTEQDRGDPLIAVPAKITDDFFMVALNDYPQAVQTNLDLLKSRNWIDIPITYTNGRRALITLEKGASGTEVFDEAMKAWAAASEPAPSDAAAPAGGDTTGATGTSSQAGQ